MTTISAIYVSWHDSDLLVRSLASLVEASGSGARPEVVVVVNEADDGSAGRIMAACPGANVITNADNRGFGPACNQGAVSARGDILLFVNPDTQASPGAIAALERAFTEHPEAVAVAPQLRDAKGASREEGQQRFQLRRLPTIWSDARELLLVDRIAPDNRWRRRARYLDMDRDQAFEVEQAAAAALAVRRDAFEAIRGFDESFWPAYWEDVDLCLRLRQLGPILYWPHARLEHVGGVAATELGRSRFLVAYYANALRYRAKHYPPATRLAYRLLLGVGMMLRALGSLGGLRGQGFSDAIRGYRDVLVMALASGPSAGDT